MFSQYRLKRQRAKELRARGIVLQYLHQLEKLAYEHQLEHQAITGKTASLEYFLGTVPCRLDAHELKTLLSTDEVGVTKWANKLSEVNRVLGDDLMLLCTRTYTGRERYSSIPRHHIMVACAGSTANDISFYASPIYPAS